MNKVRIFLACCSFFILNIYAMDIPKLSRCCVSGHIKRLQNRPSPFSFDCSDFYISSDAGGQITIKFGRYASISIIIEVLRVWLQVRHLDLGANLSAYKVIEAALNCGHSLNLSSLDMSGLNELGSIAVSADRVKNILKNCPNLTLLSLKSCGSSAIRWFIDALREGAGKQLRQIDLCGAFVGVRQLCEIVAHCPELVSLYNDYCYDDGGDYGALLRSADIIKGRMLRELTGISIEEACELEALLSDRSDSDSEVKS